MVERRENIDCIEDVKVRIDDRVAWGANGGSWLPIRLIRLNLPAKLAGEGREAHR